MDSIEELRDLLTDIIDFNDSEPTESDQKDILYMVTDAIDIVCDECGGTVEIEITEDGISIELCEACLDSAVEKETEELRSSMEDLEVEVEKLKDELIDIFGITKHYDLNY